MIIGLSKNTNLSEDNIKQLLSLRNKLNDMHVNNTDGFKENIESDLYKDIICGINSNSVFYLIKKENDVVIGYCLFTILDIKEEVDRYAKTILYIKEMFIEEKFQNKNIGSEFLDFLKKYAKDENLDIGLDVWSFNKNAINFYKKNGFVENHTYMILKRI